MKSITIAEEYKKNPELKEEDVNYIKEWASKQDHFPKNIPDELIALLLNSCYYSLETTKQTMDNYFTLRTHIPEFFTGRDPDQPSVIDVSKTSYALPLKGTTKEGYRVVVCGLIRTEPSLYHFAESMKVFNMVIDAWQHQVGASPGLIIVLDMEGMSFGHVARLHLGIMKKILLYLQEGMPVRLKGFHYVHVVPFMDAILSLMKPFMKKELIDMLVFHSDGIDSLYKCIPKEIFPEELGGKAGKKMDLHVECEQMLKEHKDWFREEEALRVDETKRAGKAKSANELFGVEGSFRKLNID